MKRKSISAKRKAASGSQRRRVAVVVESSLAGGRAILRGFAEYVRQVNHWSIFYEPNHFETSLPDWLDHWRGDGVVARVRTPRVARQLVKMRLPVVDISGNVPNTRLPVVQVDNRAIARAAAGHLLEHGFPSFGYCGIRKLWWSREREEVFGAMVAQGRRSLHVYQLPHMGGSIWFSEGERKRLADWISALPKPIAIMAANDWAGLKVLAACRRAGVMVPEEVAVVGVDNDEAICEVADPMLSSVDPRHDRVGFHAAELLDRLMQGRSPPKELMAVGSPTVVVRQSTDILAIDDQDLARAIAFVRGHAAEPIQVGDVLRAVPVSRSWLERRFHEALGRSPAEEIRRVHLERAKQLLADTDMPVPAVATAAGFRSREYLAYAFKQATGLTPREYRTRVRGR